MVDEDASKKEKIKFPLLLYEELYLKKGHTTESVKIYFTQDDFNECLSRLREDVYGNKMPSRVFIPPKLLRPSPDSAAVLTLHTSVAPINLIAKALSEATKEEVTYEPGLFWWVIKGREKKVDIIKGILHSTITLNRIGFNFLLGEYMRWSGICLLISLVLIFGLGWYFFHFNPNLNKTDGLLLVVVIILLFFLMLGSALWLAISKIRDGRARMRERYKK